MLIFFLICYLFAASNLVVKEYSYTDKDGKHNITFQLQNVMDTVFNPGAPSYIRMLYKHDMYAKQQQLLMNDSCAYEMAQMQFYTSSAHAVDLDNNGNKEFVFVYGEAAHLYEETPLWYCIVTKGKLYKVAMVKKYTDEAGAEVMLTKEEDFKRAMPAMFQASATEQYASIKATCLSAYE